MVIGVFAECHAEIIPYDPNTMNYPISVQQAEQAARDWAQNPNLTFSLEGIFTIPSDPSYPHHYVLRTADDLQKFDVNCQTGEVYHWKDITALTAYYTKLTEHWPETSQMSVPELNGIVRQFLVNKYQNFASLNMQQVYPDSPSSPSTLYLQRLSNGVWFYENKAKCQIDLWSGAITNYFGVHSPAPTVSIEPTITQSQAEQAALSHCGAIQVPDEYGEGFVYPQAGFILDNKGLWVVTDDEGLQRLAWDIIVIESSTPGYNLEMYMQELAAEIPVPSGTIYDVWIDAHTGDIFKREYGETVWFASLPAPTFNPDGGTYQSAQNVAISTVIYGANIMYTLDNSEPTEQSAAYTGPIAINQTTTIKAKVFKTNWPASDTATAQYDLTLPTPTFNPDGGTYQGTQNVTISCTISGATIRYTTDGNDPTESSAIYTGPVAISQSCTLKAKAFKSGWTASDIKSAAYTIE
jgi:hypothetical protein